MLHRFICINVVLIVCFIAQLSWTQTVKGTISDEKTGEKLPFVSVFLNNTSISTETNLEGSYQLKNIPIGVYSLIVRMTGYKPYSYKLTVEKGTNVVLDVKLSTDEKLLEEIKITSKRDKTWENQLQLFENQFLGNNVAERTCKIVNPWVLDFTSEKGVLIAKAQDVIEINNQSLGYQIRYTLNTFRFDGTQVFFSGYAEFTNLFSNDNRQKALWEANRQEAYRGSDIHFFKSLRNKTTLTEGFEFFVDKPGEDPSQRSAFFFQNQVKKLAKVSLDSAVKISSPGTFQLSLPVRVEIHFNHKEGVFSIYKDKACQVAWMETNGQPLRFNEQGILLNPQTCSVSGYLAENRVASMLPLDYQPASLPSEVSTFTKKIQKAAQEMPFFVTDRPYYYSNDLIQLSGTMYYSDPSSADTLSSILHLELVNPASRQVIVHQRLKINEGHFSSQILLNDSLSNLKSGDYLLRTYTQWMRNFSDSNYTYRWLPIVSKNERIDYTPLAQSGNVPHDSLNIEAVLTQDSLQLKTTIPNLLWASLSLTATEEIKSVPMISHFTADFDSSSALPKGNFKVEKGIELSGKIADYKPTKHTNVLLMLPKENLSFFASIDEKGNFSFKDLPIIDNQDALIQVMNAKGKPIPEAEIYYDTLASPSWMPNRTVQWKRVTTDQNYAPNFSKNGIDLQEVKVKAISPPKPMASIYKEADYVVQGKDMYENAAGMNILSALQGRVPGLRIVEFPTEEGLTKLVITMRMGASAGGFQKKTLPQPLVLVDGVPFENINQIALIPVTQVERVEVVNRAEAMTGLRGYIGVISIITKQSAKNINLTNPENQGFKKIFLYGMTEETKELTSPFANYWNPSVSIDLFQSSGIQIPKPKKSSNYRLCFEGLTKEGKVIAAEKFVEIK